MRTTRSFGFAAPSSRGSRSSALGAPSSIGIMRRPPPARRAAPASLPATTRRSTACAVTDASLGTGTAGIACVMQALAETTKQPVFAFAAEHWHRRTLCCRRSGEGFGGYLHVDALTDSPRVAAFGRRAQVSSKVRRVQRCLSWSPPTASMRRHGSRAVSSRDVQHA